MIEELIEAVIAWKTCYFYNRPAIEITHRSAAVNSISAQLDSAVATGPSLRHSNRLASDKSSCLKSLRRWCLPERARDFRCVGKCWADDNFVIGAPIP